MPTWYVVVGVALTILGFLLSLQGLWVTCRAIFSNRVLCAAKRTRQNPIKSIVTGLLITGVVAFIGVIAQAGNPVIKIIAAVLWCLYFFAAAIGTSGFVTHVGQRLISPIDDLSPWRATLRGGIAVSLSWLVPVFGWFVLPPLTILLGLGAMVLSFFDAREARQSDMELPPLNGAFSSRLTEQEMPPEFRGAQIQEGAIR